jgi:hypothetical protein
MAWLQQLVEPIPRSTLHTWRAIHLSYSLALILLLRRISTLLFSVIDSDSSKLWLQHREGVCVVFTSRTAAEVQADHG